MREIKFRAWDKEYKYMNYKVLVGNVWDTDTNYTAHAMWIEPKYVSYKKESGWCHFDERSNIELMQYTGLKDKNGVEIFEYMEIDNTYEVSFLNGSYVLTNISNGDIILLSNYMENNNGKVEITREYTKV